MSASMGFEMRAASDGCSAAAQTGCKFTINERTGVVVMAENSDPHATHVSVIHSIANDPSAMVQALSSFWIVVRLLSPSIRREKENRLITMMFLDLKEKSESRATADGVRYALTKSTVGLVGLWFSASTQDP